MTKIYIKYIKSQCNKTNKNANVILAFSLFFNPVDRNCQNFLVLFHTLKIHDNLRGK